MLCSQDTFTAYLQPQVALNYKVVAGYSHNFSMTQRNYLYDTSELQLKTRQLDLAHFSNLKIRDNQSLAFGIQYRFRKNFEPDRNNELRLTQQYNSTSKPRIARFGHRVRSEQRITSTLTTHRFRYRFAIDFPLNGEKLDVGETYVVASTESLLSVAKGQGPAYDQRITGTIGWLLTEKTKLQFGLEYRAENYARRTEDVVFLNANLIFSL
jgi:hypothetical protein